MSSRSSNIRGVFRRGRLLVCAVLTLVPLGCGDDDVTSETTGYVPEPGDTADDTRFSFTATITITDTGFEPAEAVAVFGQELTFVNETARPQTITFTNGTPNIDGAATIGPIEPGATVTYPEELDTSISLVFESDGLPGQTGRLQIDPGTDEL